MAHRDLCNKQESEPRFYISSFIDTAENFNTFIRQHWGIENKLHWTLDMVFDEDRQRKRTKKSCSQLFFHQKIALNILKQDTLKGSIVSKRLRAGWDDKFLMQLLKIQMR